MTRTVPASRDELVPAGWRPSHDVRPDWWRAEAPRADAVPASGAGAPGSAVPFWALMSFTVILLLAPQTFIPELAAFRIALLAAVAAMASYCLDRFVHGQPLVVLTPEMAVIGSLVAWALLTAPLSYWPGGSVFFLFDFYLKTLAIFWLLGSTVTTVSRLGRVAWGFSLMGVPLATTAISHFASGAFMDGASRIVGYNGPLTANPNDLALMLNLLLPFTVALLFIHRGFLVRLGLLAIVALTVGAVVVTFSRAGFITLATTSATYLVRLLRRPQRAWAVAALLLALTAIPLMPPDYLDRLQTITDIQADSTGSAQARWNDTVAAIQWVLANPIVGAGIGMNALALNDERGVRWTVIHNVYLQYAVELGLPGLVLFLVLLLRSIHHTVAVRRGSAARPALQPLAHLAEAVQIGLVAFAVAGLFSPVAYHFYFYYLAGLAVAGRAIYHAEVPTGASESGPRPGGERHDGGARAGRR